MVRLPMLPKPNLPNLNALNVQASAMTTDPIPIETAHDDMIVCGVHFSFTRTLTEAPE